MATSSIRLNPEQAAVVGAMSGDLVVRAGAGSGKTLTLAQRFVAALAEPPAGLGTDVDRILTITFTRKAAAELRERVRRALAAEGRVDLARRMDEAWVSTIDGFCARLLRRHALEAGLDPQFKIAGEVESALVREIVLARILSKQGGDAGPQAASAQVRRLIAAYGAETLAPCLTDALGRLRAMGGSPQGIQTLEEPSLEALLSAAAVASEALLNAISQAGGPRNPTQERNAKAARTIVDVAETAVGAPPAKEVLQRLAEAKISRGAGPKAETVDAARALEGLRQACADSLLAPHARAFVELLGIYERELAEEKRARGVLDYGDLIEQTSALLERREDVAQRYRERFDLVMVDEFQDTDEAQLRVLERLERGNLCVVGDEQQAIYGFRYCDPRVFERMAAAKDTRSLSTNYRSHPELLAFVNEVFGHEAFFGERAHPLAAGAEEGAPVGCGERVELHLVDPDGRTTVPRKEAQAEIVAEKVASLVAGGESPGDIVVLLRAMTAAHHFASAIVSRGVHAVVASGESFYSAPEILEMRALMKAVILPADDEALVHVLAGRLVGMSPDGLLSLRRRAGRNSLFVALSKCAHGERLEGMSEEDRGRAEWVVNALEELHRVHGKEPLSSFIHRAVHILDYDLTLLASGPGGSRAWANVLKLMRIAGEFERFEAADAGRFLGYLARCDSHAPREASTTVEGHGDAVRVMSVHAAKGLEFPIVVVADLGRSLVQADSPRFLLDSDGRTARLGVRHPADGTAFETLTDSSHPLLREAAKERTIAEEKRIFYVACTRAERALVLVGESSGPADGCLAGLLLQALDQPQEPGLVLLPQGARVALVFHRPDEWSPDDRTLLERHGCTEDLQDAVAQLAAADLAGATAAQGGEPVIAPTGPPVPERVSYSSLARFDSCPYGFFASSVLGIFRPADEASDRHLSLGSAVHAVLEALPQRDVGEAVRAASAYFRLDDRETARLTAAVDAFLASPLAKRVAAASRVTREMPFDLPLGDVRLAGSIDLLAWEGDCALVIDYKTGREVPASPEVPEAANPAEGEGPAEGATSEPEEHRGVRAYAQDSTGGGAASPYMLQAECYALAAFAAGARTVETVFVFLEQGAREERHRFEREDREGIAADIEERFERMKEGYEPKPGAACTRCPVTIACPVATKPLGSP